ncbi:leucine-rich repeat-containing G-protein coupled receptor 4-like [Chironomus tepperi]|uniref:leucine-rich repeat-containing G-protein coupled receptor 4-like n=1 Tax=Chironomus tepperi TaxID=113505 RepID=UPI00391F4D60
MAFEGLIDLEILHLSNNYLTFLHPLTLSVLPKLMNFNIENNFLTTIDSQQFIYNPLLYVVIISGNQIRTLPNDLFQAQSYIGSLYADNNQLIAAQTFGANYVYFRNNTIRNFTISSGEITIHIENNLIDKLICNSTSLLTVQRFYADNNQLTNFECIRDMMNLTDLSINNNNISKLTTKAFAKLVNLKELQILNMIKHVPPKVFSPLASLVNLQV